MPELSCCSVCDRPLAYLGMRVCVVNGVRYHAWCYLTVCAPSVNSRRG